VASQLQVPRWEGIFTSAALDFSQDMKAGVEFPPLLVVFDGTDYWLVDGFHRLEAARSILREEIDCEIRKGTLNKAL
jgi:uncharacterized ParB-like nuclease family protein